MTLVDAHCHMPESRLRGFRLAETTGGERVLVKEIPLKDVGRPGSLPTHLRAISHEANTLKKIAWASPVVIRLIDCWLQTDFSRAVLVTEWLPVTLEGILAHFRGEGLVSVGKSQARRWFAHMLAGLGAIHAAGFVHCDVKPVNLWITDDLYRCKVAGLGISRPLCRRSARGRSGAAGCGSSVAREGDDEGDSMVGSAVNGSIVGGGSMLSGISSPASSLISGFGEVPATSEYSSPEMICGRRYNETSDVFSAGCVLLELLTLADVEGLCLGMQAARELQGLGTASESPEEVAWNLIAAARTRCFDMPGAESQSMGVSCRELSGLCTAMLSTEPSARPLPREILARSARLQALLVELAVESPKLKEVLRERGSRHVQFSPETSEGGAGSSGGDPRRQLQVRNSAWDQSGEEDETSSELW